MKKLYLLLIILTNIAASITLSSYINLFNFNLNGLLILLISLIYIVVTYFIIKRKRNIDRVDLVTISIYMLFAIFIFGLSIIVQNNNNYVFTIYYHTLLLLIPNILFNIYNLI